MSLEGLLFSDGRLRGGGSRNGKREGGRGTRLGKGREGNWSRDVTYERRINKKGKKNTCQTTTPLFKAIPRLPVFSSPFSFIHVSYVGLGALGLFPLPAMLYLHP